MSSPWAEELQRFGVVVGACGAFFNLTFLVLFLNLKLRERHTHEEEDLAFLLLCTFFSFSFRPLF